MEAVGARRRRALTGEILMQTSQWYARRNDRTYRYKTLPLDPSKSVLLRLQPSFAESPGGQMATVVAANLLARMTPNVAFDIPNVQIHPLLPWRKKELKAVVQETVMAADPFAEFDVDRKRSADSQLSLGANGGGLVAHGIGWNAYVGKAPSMLTGPCDSNPIGASLAVIVAITQLFVNPLDKQRKTVLMNAFNWREETIDIGFQLPKQFGHIWAVGAGSVGTAILYFLTLVSRAFEPVIFDMDTVQVENLDRSPVFGNDDVGLPKVLATARFLERLGVQDIVQEPYSLPQSKTWQEYQRPPDLILAAANENDVRYYIESLFPPLQIYATTGKNWQVNLLRHIPLKEACSCCIFPPGEPKTEMICSTGKRSFHEEQKTEPDASLPFLSFLAGLMAVAEILKLDYPNFPFCSQRISLTTRPHPRLVQSEVTSRQGCICTTRNSRTYTRVIEPTRYAALSRLI